MNYALLLAGGKGTRMGNTGIPKQFLTIQDKPIIIYTLEKLLNCPKIHKIIIVCNKNYLDYLKDLLEEYNYREKIDITPGGKNRLQSVLNGLNFIKDKYGIKEEDVFLAHDAVRMFVNSRIIEENIKYARKYGAASTVWPVEETIVIENTENMLYQAYPREKMYRDQSPQTYNIKKFLTATSKIPSTELNKYTDLSENLFQNNLQVYPVLGVKENIKITHQFDLVLASCLLKIKK